MDITIEMELHVDITSELKKQQLPVDITAIARKKESNSIGHNIIVMKKAATVSGHDGQYHNHGNQKQPAIPICLLPEYFLIYSHLQNISVVLRPGIIPPEYFFIYSHLQNISMVCNLD